MITGWDNPDVLASAVQHGILEHQAPSLPEAIRNADVIFLCVPLDAISEVLSAMAPHVRPGTIVTDVSSVKQPIMDLAKELLPDTVPFIGGHPMAGAAESGLGHADAFLFENASYVLCGPPDSTPYREIATLVESTGARVIHLDARRHDRIAACVSHLPQLLATTLMNVVMHCSGTDSATLQLAAGGFRDMTRIASSSFNTWESILAANRSELQTVLHEFLDAWQSVCIQVASDNVGELAHSFDAARAVRSKIPKDFKGFLAPLCDIFVYAQDQPGTLMHITSTLYAKNINIKDIELLKIRVGTGGAFRLSFMDEQAADAAVTALNDAGCRAHRLL